VTVQGRAAARDLITPLTRPVTYRVATNTIGAKPAGAFTRVCAGLAFREMALSLRVATIRGRAAIVLCVPNRHAGAGLLAAFFACAAAFTTADPVGAESRCAIFILLTLRAIEVAGINGAKFETQAADELRNIPQESEQGLASCGARELRTSLIAVE
jgi:hypothetical protein